MIAGRYTRDREIGRGGMGAVWLGNDELLGRAVALKRVGRLPGDDAPDLARAEREARIAASVNHHNVVAVFDLVDDGDDRWLVMEYVPGRTLSSLVKAEGPLDPDRAALLLRQAAEALAAAHAAGIVHRDVKPSNMLVTDAGQLKILDFGIARATADATLTQTGLVTGSPAYLAPEVATGSSATDRSDVWSLGGTLHHLLTGKPPYDAADVMAALYKIVHEEPPRAANAGWLAPVLAATMTRDPAQRWSMRQVADFLAAGPQGLEQTQAMTAPVAPLPVDAEPSPAAPAAVEHEAPAPPPAARDHRRTTRSKSGLIALLAVAAVVLAGLLVWQLSGDDEPAPVADDPTTDATSQTTPSDTPAEPSSPTSSATQSPEETKAAMEGFVEDYLSTVTSDPGAAFGRLTPAFQEQSNGYDGFVGWWGTIESAQVRSIDADPDAGTVSYTVEYVKKDGSGSTDEVTLQLVEDGGGWLIDGEA